MEIQILQKKSRFSKEKWYFRIVAKNGKVLATSEKYHNYFDCSSAAWSIFAAGRNNTLDMENPSSKVM